MRVNEANKVIFAGICGLVLTVGVARFAYTPMLPAMQAQAGLTDIAAGWFATSNYAGYFIGTMLAAALTDPLLKHRLYGVGLLIAVVTTAGMGITQNIFILTVLRFAAGLSSAAGMLLGSSMVLAGLVRLGHRPELGIHFAGMGLGIVATGLTVAATSAAFDYAEQWLIMALLGAALIVPAWNWMPIPTESRSDSEQRKVVAASPSQQWIWLLTGAYFCAGFGYVVCATFLVVTVERQPGLEGSGATAWIVAGLAAVPASALWDRIARSVGEERSLMLAFAGQIASILSTALGGTVTMVALAAALYGATFIGIVSLTLALVGRKYPANPVRAMARLTLGYGSAQVLAPITAGGIAEATGSYSGALYLTAAIITSGMVLLARLPHCNENAADVSI